MTRRGIMIVRNRMLSVALIFALMFTVMQPSLVMSAQAASAKTQKISMTTLYKIGASAVKEKTQKVQLDAESNVNSKLSYKVTGYPSGMKKYVSVSKKGLVTLKKNSKKGTYKIKVTAAAKGKYKKVSKTATVKVVEESVVEDESAATTYLSNGEAYTDTVSTDLVIGDASVTNDAQDSDDFNYQDGFDDSMISIDTEDLENDIAAAQNGDISELKNALTNLETDGASDFATKLAQGVGVSLASAAAKYLANLAINAILSSCGVDTRSSTEVKLDQIIDKLNEIYGIVNDTNVKVTTLCKKVSLKDYADAMNTRNEKLELLNQNTTDKYMYIIETLGEGYDEYIENYDMLQILLDEDNYQSKDGKEPVVNQNFIDTCKKNFDSEFWQEYLFMNKKVDGTASVDSNYEANSLGLYMAYRIQMHGSDIEDTLSHWEGSGTSSSIATTKYLLSAYTKGVYTSDGETAKSYPEIYDAYVYKSYPWEHQGYELRKMMRDQDSLVLNEAYVMSEMYCLLNRSTDKALDNERTSLEKLMSQYNKTLEDNQVVEHNDYYICQIPGCEYVFARNIIFYDYYRGLSDVRGVDVNSGGAKNSYNAMAFNNSITYDYYKLSNDQKNQYTYWDHSTLGNADNPIDVARSGSDISSYATPVSNGNYYLPMSAYKTMYEYYKSKNNGNPVSIYAIMQSVYGVELPANTRIVTDEFSSSVRRDGRSDSSSISWENWYCSAFHFIRYGAKTGSDSARVQTCLNDDASAVYDTEFMHSGNLHETFWSSKLYWNNIGYVSNYRFCGMGVIGKIDTTKIPS